ncbi:hypothetical protein TUMEXPCC7403_02180 [Tumidithrix helvetica PCC 7403]|uniref:hypothetical protein n=1 Tax=Tumidithrix helvetica TaxID=3457545 RepID=UPI003CBC5BE5
MASNRFPASRQPPIGAAAYWQSHTMTSTNYLYVLGQLIHYGVDSMDDEQAFHSLCPIEEFLNSEGNWWMQVNLSAEALLIREFIERAIGQNSQ